MFSHFFIDRPIFASVLSIVITLSGLVAGCQLPVAQYPQITPPSIIVSCTYPGASAKVVAESVAEATLLDWQLEQLFDFFSLDHGNRHFTELMG